MTCRSSASARARRARSAFTERSAPDTKTRDERLFVLTRGAQELIDRHVAVLEPVRQVVNPLLDLGLDQRPRGSCLRPDPTSAAIARSFRASRACASRTREIWALQVVAQFVERLELRRLGRPLVGGFGQDLLLHVLHEHLHGRLGLQCRQQAGSVVVNSRMSPGDRTAELFVEARDRRARNRPRRGSPRRATSSSPGRVATQVDRHVIAVTCGPTHRDELTELLAQPVDLCVDVLVCHLDRRERDDETRVSRNRDGRAHLDDRVEATRHPWSVPETMSMSGAAIGSTSVSTTACAYMSGSASRIACSRSTDEPPSRASRTWRGTLPGLKPGTRSCPASRRAVWRTASVDLVLVHLDREADPVPLDQQRRWLA